MKNDDLFSYLGLKKFSPPELMWSVSGGTALCIFVFFIGSAIQSYSSKPDTHEECIPKDIIITKDFYGHNSCNPGTKILKPIKVNIDGEERVITQCVCPNTLSDEVNDKGDTTPTPELQLYVEEQK